MKYQEALARKLYDNTMFSELEIVLIKRYFYQVLPEEQDQR